MKRESQNKTPDHLGSNKWREKEKEAGQRGGGG